MPLVNTKTMLLNAQENNYAIGAFNVENMEMVMAVIAAAEELHAPVILQTTPSTVRYAGVELYVANVSALAKKALVPVALHLDHGDSIELVKKALAAGYTSIMIDGSKLPLAENIALTAEAVKLCGQIPVEGELGQVGGKEDDTECENAGYTIPAEAARFEKESGITSMAVGVGTAHGVYAVAPVLNTPLISELKKLISVPMVLHGASGLTDASIRDCIARGICKVNFATELRIAYTDGVKKVLAEKPDTFDPKVYGKVGMENVKKLVIDRMCVCGCQNRS